MQTLLAHSVSLFNDLKYYSSNFDFFCAWTIPYFRPFNFFFKEATSRILLAVFSLFVEVIEDSLLGDSEKTKLFLFIRLEFGFMLFFILKGLSLTHSIV
jgi:hypothetical protein